MANQVDKTFHWSDYLVFIATLLISLGIGLYYAFAGDKQRTTKEYLMGNRSLKVVPVALSMFMSYVSAILVLGNTAEMYTRGTQMWMAAVGSSGAFLFAALLFVPLFYPLRITSSFEYLERRFRSRAVKLTGTMLLMLSQILYMGIAMFSPATALEAVTPIPVWASIIATGVVATIYTTLGGMKAVVWTDVFQAFVMVGGLILVLIFGSNEVGGLTKVWNVAQRENRIQFFNMNPDPLVRMSFWSVVVGRVVASMQTTGTGQTSVQRYCSVSTLMKGRISVLLNVPAMFILYTLTCLCGLTVFAYYTNKQCDPLRARYINNSNQLLPYFIMDVLGRFRGLPGLFVAVLFSGALSTLSSSLNSLSAVTWKDMLEWKFKHIPESRKALATKILVAIYGAIAVGMAFMARVLGGHVLQASQSFVSGTAGPLLGMFILGSFFPFSNWMGAISGGIIGLAFTMWITIGAYVTRPYVATLPTNITLCSNITNITAPATDPAGVFPLYRISFMWFSTVGTLTCILVGIIVSLITGPEKPSEQDPTLIIPVVDRLCCCLPAACRRIFWCKVDHENKVYPGDDDKAEEIKGTELDSKPITNAYEGLHHRKGLDSVPGYVPYHGDINNGLPPPTYNGTVISQGQPNLGYIPDTDMQTKL